MCKTAQKKNQKALLLLSLKKRELHEGRGPITTTIHVVPIVSVLCHLCESLSRPECESCSQPARAGVLNGMRDLRDAQEKRRATRGLNDLSLRSLALWFCIYVPAWRPMCSSG
jgi:hypothetical protein